MRRLGLNSTGCHALDPTRQNISFLLHVRQLKFLINQIQWNYSFLCAINGVVTVAQEACSHGLPFLFKCFFDYEVDVSVSWKSCLAAFVTYWLLPWKALPLSLPSMVKMCRNILKRRHDDMTQNK